MDTILEMADVIFHLYCSRPYMITNVILLL